MEMRSISAPDIFTEIDRDDRDLLQPHLICEDIQKPAQV